MLRDKLRQVPILRKAVAMVRRSVSRKLPPRHANDYATHLPVLIGLARLLPVKRVLELGSGRYSTAAFLGRKAFPDLVTLESIEDDPAWFKQMAALAGSDPRAKLRLVPAPLRNSLPPDIDRHYDVVFVDDSPDAIQRAATIHRLSQLRLHQSVIVIHDYEIKAIRQAARGFAHRVEFTAFNPTTALAWNGAALDKRKVRQLSAFITAHAGTVAVDDLAAWVAALARAGWRLP